MLSLLFVSWVLLGVARRGSGPSPDAFPVPLTVEVPLILFVLLAMVSVLAWLTHRSGVSWPKLGIVATFVAGLVAVVVVTAAVSAPVQALWLARDMVWAGSNIWDYQKYPQQTVANPSPAYHFPEDLSPQLFQAIQYTINGQPQQSSFADFLTSSKTMSVIVLKDGSLVYEGYANGYSRDSIVIS